MNRGRIAAVTAAFASITLFSVAGAQAATHRHHHHHHMAAAVEAAPGAVVAAGYYSPSNWGDHDCSPGFPGCRPNASKDWSKP
jgi:hypothetical protein